MELLADIRGLAVDADGYLTVTINGVITGDMEVLRFQQNAAGGDGKKRRLYCNVWIKRNCNQKREQMTELTLHTS